MKALVYNDYCDLSGMRIDDVPDPEPGRGDVLVEVHAASINPIDWKVRSGLLRSRFELDFPDVPGRDLSGVVVALGEGVTDLKVGDEVFGTCPPDRWGSHAQLIAVNTGVLGIKAKNVGHVEASAIPLVGHTALTALENTATIEEGMRVLVHAGAGGVGAFALQYCRSRGAITYSTCSTENASYVQRWGGEPIDYSKVNFAEELSDIDLVYDTMGGDIHLKSYDVLKPGGMMVCLNADPIPNEKPRDDVSVQIPPVGYEREGVDRISELVLERAVQPTVGTVFFFDQAIDAYRLSESGHARGKIVLRMK